MYRTMIMWLRLFVPFGWQKVKIVIHFLATTNWERLFNFCQHGSSKILAFVIYKCVDIVCLKKWFKINSLEREVYIKT